MNQTLTQQGITALRKGDIIQARQLLEAATYYNPLDIQAWLWLSGAVSTDAERVACLQQVLRLDPGNAVATQGLAQLASRGALAGPARPVPVLLPSPFLEAERGEPQDGVVFSVKPSLWPFFIRFLLDVFYPAGAIMLLVALLANFGETIPPFFAVVAAIGFVGALGFGVFAVLANLGFLFRCLASRYTLTRRRLIYQVGVFTSKQRVIPLSAVQDVSYRQSWSRRWLGIGDIWIESGGTYGVLRLHEVADCQYRVEQILHQVHNYQHGGSG